MTFIKECLWINTSGREEKGKEGSWSGWREKSNCDSASMTALVNAPGSSVARMTLRSCPVCAQAKSLQSCLTLCWPIDYSPPGCSVHGILQARLLEWVVMEWVAMPPPGDLLPQGSHPRLFCLLYWQAALSMGFSRPDSWRGLSCPLQGTFCPRDHTRVSSVSCTGGRALHHQRHLGSRSCPSRLDQNGRTFVFSHQWFGGSPGHVERLCMYSSQKPH